MFPPVIFAILFFTAIAVDFLAYPCPGAYALGHFLFLGYSALSYGALRHRRMEAVRFNS